MEIPWRVGIVGINSLGLFLLERLKLQSRFQVVIAADSDPSRASLTLGSADAFSDELETVLTQPVDCAIFADRVEDSLVERVLTAGKSVIFGQPALWSSHALKRFGELTLKPRQFITTYCPRRWSSDFLSASSAIASGRLGEIRSARLSIAEMSISQEGTADILRDQSFHLFDQLLLFVASKPVQIFATSKPTNANPDQNGRVIVIGFASGCTAQLDLQFHSRLGYRSGWALEGDCGSYRNHKLYTTTTAGEIVDEPTSIPFPSDAAFFDELDCALSGKDFDLPTLTQSVHVVQLMELIEQSISTGQVIRP